MSLGGPASFMLFWGAIHCLLRLYLCGILPPQSHHSIFFLFFASESPPVPLSCVLFIVTPVSYVPSFGARVASFKMFSYPGAHPLQCLFRQTHHPVKALPCLVLHPRRSSVSRITFIIKIAIPITVTVKFAVTFALTVKFFVTFAVTV